MGVNRLGAERSEIGSRRLAVRRGHPLLQTLGEHDRHALKTLLKDKDLTLSRSPNECYRTKVQCLRVCTQGPILVVYPEGTWYQGMTPDRIPRFVQEHLIGGRPIREWIFAEHPLSTAPVD